MKINKLFQDRNEPGRVMDEWSEVGLASNLNLNGIKKKGKGEENITFSPHFWQVRTVGVSYREKGEKLLLLSMIYRDRVVGIRLAKI